MGRLSDEDQEKREAEQGYSVRGEREVKLREWFSLREAGEKAGDFDRRVAVLRAKKWAKEHPEQRQAIVLRYIHKPDVKARSLKLQKRRRHERLRKVVYTCQWKRCGVQFCRLPQFAKGVVRKYCCDSHCSMAWMDKHKAPRAPKARPYTCRRCGGLGHNRLSCTAPTAPQPPEGPTQRRDEGGEKP